MSLIASHLYLMQRMIYNSCSANQPKLVLRYCQAARAAIVQTKQANQQRLNVLQQSGINFTVPKEVRRNPVRKPGLSRYVLLLEILTNSVVNRDAIMDALIRNYKKYLPSEAYFREDLTQFQLQCDYRNRMLCRQFVNEGWKRRVVRNLQIVDKNF